MLQTDRLTCADLQTDQDVQMYWQTDWQMLTDGEKHAHSL